jgi:hypothetical protein
MEEELPAAGYEALVTLNFENITNSVLSAVDKDMTPDERAKAIEKRVADIEKEEDKPEKGTEGRVVSMLDGSSYYLFTYLKIKDVRLVYAPPASIGNYGGDIDNWMWPRHGGDFSFMRAYVGPDGIPAEYSENNVPYEPRAYLPFSSKGVKLHDFTFVLGYPGQTMRYRTSCSVDWNQNLSYPFTIELFQDMIDFLESESEKDEELAIKLSSMLQGLNNALKNYQGMLEGMEKTRLLERKKTLEQNLVKFLQQNPELNKEYGDVLPSIKKAYEEHRKGFERDLYIRYLTFSQTLSWATTIQKWGEEKVKPDEERDPRFMDYKIPERKKRMEISAKNYHAPTDAKILKMLLNRLALLPKEEYPEFLAAIVGEKEGEKAQESISKFVDELFDKTRFTSHEDRMAMFDMSADELEGLNDPFVKFAKEVNKELDLIKEKDDYFSGYITQLRPKYYKLLAEWKGEDLYPDANRTIRFTYGTVRGYIPKDAVYYRYITGLDGVVEKHTGEYPFNAPEKLLEISKRKDYGDYVDSVIKDIPVDFLSTTDITGGNSGSPVLNGDGEIIGCAFDGNYESIVSDWQFSNRLTRTISVDARYILFTLDKFSGAKELLNELTVH